ncbi:hypothetical protein [Clavibacter sepedonicus]|uniref:hypothetical protein n=1 Tax=Clavibacter sepedonicus TaxID=31964 RepID=UPI001FF0C7A2|nr:hypothetical protein [Clavibacter sepedonicus]
MQLSRGASAKGQVYRVDGVGSSGSSVRFVPVGSAVDGVRPTVGLVAYTDRYGRFSLDGITPGEYVVYVTGPAQQARWAGGTGSLATATRYTATLDGQLPAIYVQFGADPTARSLTSRTAAAAR